jgi:hypothetical protein
LPRGKLEKIAPKAIQKTRDASIVGKLDSNRKEFIPKWEIDAIERATVDQDKNRNNRKFQLPAGSNTTAVDTHISQKTNGHKQERLSETAVSGMVNANNSQNPTGKTNSSATKLISKTASKQHSVLVGKDSNHLGPAGQSGSFDAGSCSVWSKYTAIDPKS